MDVLSEIIVEKGDALRRRRNAFRLRRCGAVRTPHALRAALRAEGINIIAEFKRRSPSKGVIRADANLSQIVESYEAGGAVGISVLTEEDYFDGSLDDLRTVKSNG